MLRALALTAATLLTLTALIAGTRLLARTDPPPEVAIVLPDDTCPTPCWQGLRPGYLTAGDVAAWLDAPPAGWQVSDVYPTSATIPAASVPVSWRITGPGHQAISVYLPHATGPFANQIELAPARLTLGDVVAALGPPAGVDLLRSNSGVFTFVSTQVYYPAHNLIVKLMPGVRLDASARVASLIYIPVRLAESVYSQPWRSFGSYLRYARLGDQTP